jgi:hypothetical protein
MVLLKQLGKAVVVEAPDRVLIRDAILDRLVAAA